MAHGINTVIKREPGTLCKEGKTGIGSRRIFPPHFKLQVLDSYRNDADCKGNQRATARKYGIHRRQIQKWLQAEINLRNSVGKVKSGECAANPEARKCGGIELALRSVGNRQRGDSSADALSESRVVAAVDARVPALSPADAWIENNLQPAPGHVPLDFTTHSRGSISASPVTLPCDPAAPIDLSLKRLMPVGEHRAPVYNPPTSFPSVIQSSPPHLSPTVVQDPDVWDLSTKSLKRKHEESLHSPVSNTSSIQSTKPVKLFKPYLDDLHDTSNSSEDCHLKQDFFPKTEAASPCCNNYPYHSVEPHYYNNNNNICDVKGECTYTLHELHPNGSVSYCYPVTSPCYMYPGSECESGTYCLYEEPSLLQPTPMKQRQSYSLDFKLSAIECYYQDEFCRGNQRAVASKYNIHRRQVQKWLKQEDELRQRNENIKQVHAVS